MTQDRINKQLENIEKKLDVILEQTWRQDERIKHNNEQIDEIKKETIPNAVKNGNNKIKIWFYGSAIGVLISIIGTLISWFK